MYKWSWTRYFCTSMSPDDDTMRETFVRYISGSDSPLESFNLAARQGYENNSDRSLTSFKSRINLSATDEARCDEKTDVNVDRCTGGGPIYGQYIYSGQLAHTLSSTCITGAFLSTLDLSIANFANRSIYQVEAAQTSYRHTRHTLPHTSATFLLMNGICAQDIAINFSFPQRSLRSAWWMKNGREWWCNLRWWATGGKTKSLDTRARRTRVGIKCRCKWRLALRRGINSRRMSSILLLVTFPRMQPGGSARRTTVTVWGSAFPCRETSVGAYLMSTPIARFLNALRLGLLITMLGAREINAWHRVAFICITYSGFHVLNYSSLALFYGWTLSVERHWFTFTLPDPTIQRHTIEHN